ncbi:MAG TPA: PEGA domain-containing protein, partial [Blastocatellia bacterium]|nr:PEGA domain-containing protein [Blastocatellia bacterium]
ILSELAHSEQSSVYKAMDTEAGQTVALKAINLDGFGEQRAAVLESVHEEAAASKGLASHNIALLNSVAEIDGRLCASMEYVQGNSVATMLARKEGFSIWDLQDIARQACQGLDHAHVRKVMHCSLEPAKIMVQWDGIVKLLGFGMSKSGMPAAQAAGKPPEILHYMSPEQLRGDPVDARSNLFSLGAILYEMVTERKAFSGDDAEQLRQAILEMTPVAVNQLNPKTHPALSAVIMKALSKSPEERYQSGQELVNDLEKCKASPAKVAAGTKPAAAVAPKGDPVVAAKNPAAKAQPVPQQEAPPAAAKAAAASAGWAGPAGNTPKTPYLDPSSQFVTSCVKATVEAAALEEERMSAGIMQPEAPRVQAPRIKVDPTMDESRQPGSKGLSFSEISELPPLKEVYIEPAPPEEVQIPETQDPVKAAVFRNAAPEKPRTPPREVAKKAVSEIKKTPPQLFIYSIAGAAAVILMVIAGIAYHIHSGESDDDSNPAPAANEVATPAPVPSNASPVAPAVAATPVPAQVVPEPPAEAQPTVSITPKYNPKTNRKKTRALPSAPAIIAGQLSIDSTPQGAQIQVDGQAAGVTPLSLANLMPGQHMLTVSKPGFVTDTRTINLGSGGKSAVSVQLELVAASVSVHSDPPGAAIWMDGRDTGKATPAQISVDRPGTHTFVFKKQGYLEETATPNLQLGQTFQLTPILRVLGNTDEIKFGGKLKKVFGGSDTAGMGVVSIKTQPKGAQIAVNNRIVDRATPTDFYLNPGNYVIDVTMTGFKSLHKVISVEKNGKVVIEESLDRE